MIKVYHGSNEVVESPLVGIGRKARTLVKVSISLNTTTVNGCISS